MTDLPAAGFFSIPGRSNAEAKQAQDDMLAFVRQMLGGQPETTLTLTGDAVVPTRGMHAIDTETGAATDNLANLATSNLPDGALLMIRGVSAARVVTVKHNAGGSGQIALFGAADVLLDAPSKRLLLQRVGANWEEVDRFKFLTFPVPIALGGTGAATPAAARAALGITEGGYPADGRLTLASGVPVTAGDVVGASTLFYAPYIGNRIALFDGTSWGVFAFTERSLALSGLVSGRMYDVFLWNNAGTLALELTAWTDNSNRAAALVRQDGVLVRAGALTRRFLGSICTTGTATTEDSAQRRRVKNYYNRVDRDLGRVETAASWTYTSSAWRQANANAANQFDFVTDVAEDVAEATVMAYASNSSGWTCSVGVGVNSTSANSAQIRRGSANSSSGGTAHAHWRGVPPIGLNTIAWLESSSPNATTTWTGTALNGDNGQSGIIGRVRA